ncbi:MAG: hypothetical protein EU540_08070 [Promethearchaeota archaeon]|nr:MAG: hypothetical protein EU540_08070 [Candidatus Lokiarchaeota archaeon]
MKEENNSKEEIFFEDIIKKTKTGSITLPKSLRDELFGENPDIFFKLTVPQEKDKIILDILSEEQARLLSDKLKKQKPKISKSKKQKIKSIEKKAVSLEPNWGEYFIYEFNAQSKVQPLLESAFYKFAEKPPNLEDAMGRVKYALISFLSSTKTENAKLYFSIIKFLVDVIEKFNQPNLIDWIFEKIIPNIKSKYLYELALLEMVDISLRTKRFEKAETFIFYILKNIDDYPKSEMYNIMNSFKQLVKTIRNVEKTHEIERSSKIDILLKEKLLEYGQGPEDIDYKIQIVEFLEDLNYIELAYKLAKDIQVNLPSESVRIEEVRKIVRRLHSAPITEQKDVM